MIKKILIADDSLITRMQIKNCFHKEFPIYTFEFTELIDGKTALSTIKQPNEFDIILLDIEMPFMNGLEVLKRSRLYTKIPIGVISSLCKEDMVEAKKAKSFGASFIVSKPIGSFEFKEAVRLFLK